MKSEYEKMLAGVPFIARDPELQAARLRARQLCLTLNATDPHEMEQRAKLTRELLGESGELVWLVSPFHCDYGLNIKVGTRVLFNFNCVVLDCGEVRLGDRVFIGPAVQIYTVNHPLDADDRATGICLPQAVVIDSDVWIGGGSIICPGVHIGERSVIGAGSVVTRDIPANVVAAGNPCRVIREISAQDKMAPPAF